ncbi:MAG: hypothetical protein ACFB50_05720 [Rubrobacteraceae bacterium]
MTEQNDINFGRVMDWIEGRLSEEEAGIVEKEVAMAGEQARREVEWLRAFAGVSEKTVLEAPPPEVRETLNRRFASYAEENRAPGFFRRIMATLAFDSNTRPAVAGFRSATGPSSRQLVYDAQVAEIAINVRGRPGNGHVDIYGQIFPDVEESPDAFSVQLLKGTDEIGLTAADELGEFAFERVEQGTYEMVLSAAQIEFLITPVELYP